MDKLIPNGRIWINTPEGAFLGYGRIELLEKIQALGSIRQAAIEMKMSYQQAWSMIEQMNSRYGKPLVISKRGGKGGGQAILTEDGLRNIALFKKFNEEFQLFLSNFKSNLSNI